MDPVRTERNRNRPMTEPIAKQIENLFHLPQKNNMNPHAMIKETNPITIPPKKDISMWMKFFQMKFNLSCTMRNFTH